MAKRDAPQSGLPAADAEAAEALAASQTWYRGWRTADLLAEAEAVRWEYAELGARADDGDDDPALAGGLDFTVWKLTEAAKEVGRRERLRSRPEAPGWPTQWPDARSEAARLAGAVTVEAFAAGYLGVELRPSGGGRMVGRCPIPGHDDGSASFTVYPAGRGWFCFGCRRGGTLFSLLFACLPDARGYADAVAILGDWDGPR